MFRPYAKMIVKKLATSPITNSNPSSSVAFPLPKIAYRPSRSGNPDWLYRAAPPGSAVLKTSVKIAAISSVCIASTDPLGTSRWGSIDSSAARGTSSIARKNQIANGRDLKIPLTLKGNHGPPPPGIGSPLFEMFVHNEKSSFPEKIAARKKNTRTAMDKIVIVTVNRMVASIPMMLIPTKMM